MVTLDQGGAGRSSVSIRASHSAAVRFAELSWVQRSTTAPSGESWRVVPDASPHIIHHRMRDGRTRTLFVGPRSVYVDVAQRERDFTVGVRLRPGVLPLLLGVHAWELRDRSVRVDAHFGPRGRDVVERLSSETDPRVVETLLLSLLNGLDRCRDPDWRVRGFLDHVSCVASRDRDGHPQVHRVARELGVSERSLRDVFRSEVGLRPKEVQRIQRLHWAVAEGLCGRSDGDVARLVGYADQAHMIRETKALLGSTPAKFRARGGAVLSKTWASAPTSVRSHGIATGR